MTGGKPRVLLLTTYYHPVLGGVEIHARQLVTYLHDHGFQVQVVTKRVGREQPSETRIDGVAVHRVGPAGERNAAGKWLALPAFFAKVVALARDVDVLVCIDYRGIGIAAVAAGRLVDRPVIAQGETAGVLGGAGRPSKPSSSLNSSNTGLPPESAVAKLLKAPIRAIYRRADHIVCIGRDLEREALDAGVSRDRVHYLPHGVDVERFRPSLPGERASVRKQLGWPLDRTVVLFLGRLSLEKGVMDLLAAWRSVNREDAILSLVGPNMSGHSWDAGGPGREYVAAHGLGGRVRFEGPTDDPAPFYRAADVFVQPSHFEALGNTAIEAMASSLPVVAARIGGLADFCVDGENALLHEPRDPASLAGALARMLDDGTLRARLAEAARRTAVERFELGGLLQRYQQLIESTARPR